LKIYILNSKENMGKAAAEKAAEILRKAIKEKGKANFIAATGASQFEFLDHLTKITSLEWGETTMFHLDEYIGLSEDHPASFRRYLQERLISKVHPGKVFLIAGDAPGSEEECERLNDIISQYEIDVAFVGIGENGHLAFNDPPADFETEKPYIIVELDTACRRQQLGEGWFNSLEEVPQKAISMSVNQIMKAKNIICTVPDKRKAQAVKDCFGGEEISPYYPASILKRHDHCYVFLDEQSAMYLK